MSIEDEELRRRKFEEALEIKSLRRIISAYLNYPEAAEEDIRRYERCFRRLPLAHKAMLSHLPLKFQKLRWCVSQNSYFIFEMLKAFEPPVDMTVDVDTSEDQTVENASDNRLLSSEMILPCQSGSKLGKLHFSDADECSSGEGGRAYESFQPETVSKEKKIDHSNENAGNCSQGSECYGKVEHVDDANGFQSVKTSPGLSSMLDCDGHLLL